jgi:hypothetical protein
MRKSTVSASGGAVLAEFPHLWPCVFLSTPKAVELGAGLNDIGAVSDMVDQRLAQPGIRYHRGPFRERQIGGDDDRDRNWSDKRDPLQPNVS